MKPVTVYCANNDKGESLFQNIKNLCSSLGLVVNRPSHVDTRKEFIKVFRNSSLIILDCSLDKEGGHIYHVLHEWIKYSKKYIIVSRTPIARNILTFQQFVPIHGQAYSNEVILEWLDINLPIILHNELNNPSSILKGFQGYYKAKNIHYDYFLSFRGSAEVSLRKWKQNFEIMTGTKIKMAEEGEYFYPTECLTSQQMWEGVVKLMYTMWNIGKVLIHKSDDYFDSFWTTSEFLTMISLHYPIQNNVVQGIYLLKQDGFNPLEIGKKIGLERLDRRNKRKLDELLNNSDPYTIGPEVQIKPQGLQKLIVPLQRMILGHYKPEFTSPNWWDVVRVPCPHCKPIHRKASDVDWTQHLECYQGGYEEVDYYGYFAVNEESLRSGRVSCPTCKRVIQVENKKEPRTLWVPILTTEKDQNRPVIKEYSLWEVVTG